MKETCWLFHKNGTFQTNDTFLYLIEIFSVDTGIGAY